MTDVVLATLPTTIFYKLQMSLKTKLGLCIILSLGLVAAICGAIKTKFLASLNARSDLTWDTYDLLIWSDAELFVIIVCGSIPPIKPLYDMAFSKNRRPGDGYSRSGKTYLVERSWKSGASSKRPVDLDDRTLMGSIDMENGKLSAAQEKGRQGEGITRVTDISVVHGR